MKIHIKNGLPIVSVLVSYEGQSIELDNVLFDTGCSATIFDTDMMDAIGLHIDFVNGIAERMYGVGGIGEVCYAHLIQNLTIDSINLHSFQLQLGSIQEPYGFDGILGIDYMQLTGLSIDFETMRVTYPQNKRQ